ncbi:MAG: toxin-antitoxin system TumE family protein [Promethearchaeota archaeon]
MDRHEKLELAQDLLQKHTNSQISSIQREPNRPVLKIRFINGILLYIRYNDYSEYSYQIIFSQSAYDRIRFDNYDDQWNIDTKPHHKHERGGREVSRSPMCGDPTKDILKLFEYLK